MEVLYHGVDIVETGKLRDVMRRHREFAEDVFTGDERAHCERRREPAPHFGARFAAKEAVLKALGVGAGWPGVDSAFREIEVRHGAGGRPEIALSGWVARVCRAKGVRSARVSLSHSGSYAVASVILTG